MTVVSRTMLALPERAASDTWARIIELIAPNTGSPARGELAAVAGVVCSCIADEALARDALVVHGVGPRLRIYALYGDDAVDGDSANESTLSWVPTDGNWRMSIPCLSDDLAWVQAKLAATSTRVTARQVGEAVDGEDETTGNEGRAAARALEGTPRIDLDAFFRH